MPSDLPTPSYDDQIAELTTRLEAARNGLAAAEAAGFARAVAIVRAQADLPSLMHFDRPSDFRKGVLSCLAALEAGRPA